jgi:replicative DNA helicase
MIEVQVLSKILNEGKLSLVSLNNITPDYFLNYPEEYKFILEHKDTYGNVPDKETFLAKFPDFNILDVQESDEYLIRTFQEEHLYATLVPVLNKVASLVQSDARIAIDYLRNQLPKFKFQDVALGTDIIHDSDIRYEEWEERKEHKDDFMLPSGFEELDDYIGGYSCGEELVVIFARTGQGKTWILLKSLEHIWRVGKRVGLIEPEMTASKTGYRFDTLHGNVSNRSLMMGEDISGYDAYISKLQSAENPFIVASPKDFNRSITVSKLKSFVESNNLDVLGIDGISYLTDERANRGDNRTTALTNISEDLMDLSIELGIPVLVVCQSNREGAQRDSPELENIRDSDGIAYNASLVISAKQQDPGIVISIKKNRNGVTGVDLTYHWDIDRGEFQYVPDDSLNPPAGAERARNIREQFNDGSEVF